MSDISKRGFDCDDDGGRGERGKRGHRGPTGPAGPALFQFSGSVPAGAALFPPGSNLADGGATSPAFPDTLLTGGPYPAYPLAQAQTISALAVNVFANIPVTSGTISFQLVTVPDDASAPETPVGSPVSFGGLVIGNNTTRVLFAPVVLNPGVRLALRVSADDLLLNADLLVAATAG